MIESLAQKLAKFLPQYGATLWGVLSAPIQWTVVRSPRSDEAWPAMMFWAASFALYTLSRFLMFERLPDPSAYVAAIFLSNGLHLVLTALGFFAVWHIFRRPLAISTMLTATAYCWGAVIPIQTVAVVLMFGIMRVLDEALFTTLGNLLNGCRDFGAVQNAPQLLFSALDSAGTPGLWAIGLYAGLFLGLTAALLVYAVAFLRGLGQLSGARGGLFFVMCCLGIVVWSVAGSVGSGVYLMLLGDTSACLTVGSS